MGKGRKKCYSEKRYWDACTKMQSSRHNGCSRWSQWTMTAKCNVEVNHFSASPLWFRPYKFKTWKSLKENLCWPLTARTPRVTLNTLRLLFRKSTPERGHLCGNQSRTLFPVTGFVLLLLRVHNTTHTRSQCHDANGTPRALRCIVRWWCLMMASFLHVLLGRCDLDFADLVRPAPLVLPSSSHFCELSVSGTWWIENQQYRRVIVDRRII